MSTKTVSLLDLPDENLLIICKLALIADPPSDSTMDEVYVPGTGRLRQYTKIVRPKFDSSSFFPTPTELILWFIHNRLLRAVTESGR